MEVFRSALTRPGFANLLVVMTGWVITTGSHAVTQTLVATSVAGRRHHEAFHRFFSRGTWTPDALGWRLYRWVMRVIPEGKPIRVALDDTLAPKKGRHVFGIGSRLDAVRSTRAFRVFCFGHCWVVLAMLVTVPFSRRPWALPILFRLDRNKKECEKKRQRYRKKTELAREMLDVFHGWVGSQRVELAADVAYCNDTVTRGLPDSFVLFGAMRPDAVLTALPTVTGSGPQGGRRRKRGDELPKPEALARDPQQRWQTCEADLYGSLRKVHYKELCGQWYRACGLRLLRIVIVQVRTGTIGLRVFFSTDATLSVRDILERYAGRWSIETCFRNLKQLLGSATPRRAHGPPSNGWRRLSASPTRSWSSGSSSTPTPTRSRPRRSVPGTATSRASRSPMCFAPPSASSRRSMFWIQAGVSPTCVARVHPWHPRRNQAAGP